MRKRSILRLLILTAAYHLAANFAHPVEPTFFKLLEMPDYMFGVAFACMSVTNFLFSPFWGHFSDRHGPSISLTISFFFYSIGQLFFFLSRSVYALAFARFFSGIFIGGISVAQILYLIENSPEGEKGQNLAKFATISAVFSAFGYLIGGVIGDLSLNADFYVQIISLMLLSFAHYFLLEDMPREHKKETTLELIREANPFRSFLNAKPLMSFAFVCFLMVVLFTNFATNCYDQCFNYFIKDQFNFPPSYNGYLKGAVGLITLLANSTICVFLLKRTDIKRSIIYVFTICTVMIAGIILIDSVVPFIILNVLFFAFNAVYKPLLQSMLNTFGKKSSGAAVGVYNSMSAVGTIAGSLVAGFVYTIAPKGSFFFTGAAFLLSILFSFLNRRSAAE